MSKMGIKLIKGYRSLRVPQLSCTPSTILRMVTLPQEEASTLLIKAMNPFILKRFFEGSLLRE